MVMILPSFDAASEKSFTRLDTVEGVHEPRWHDWSIVLAILGLGFAGFWVLWGAELMSWVKSLH